jgi:hypothetical protein
MGAFVLFVFVSLFTWKGVLRPFNSDPTWTPVFDKAYAVSLLLVLVTAFLNARCPTCKAWLQSRRCPSCERDGGASVSESQS